MSDLKALLTELDVRLLDTFQKYSLDLSSLHKTDHINALGDTSLKIDLLLEDLIISFFKEKQFPCIIEAEERGRTILSDEPEFLVIADPLDGSTNFSKGIPLVSCGVAIAQLRKDAQTAFFSDIQAAFVHSLYTKEFFFAEKDQGATLNNESIATAKISNLSKALTAIDIDHLPKKERELLDKLKILVRKVRGTRRFGSNLLDMVYVAAGKLEIMIDLRGTLSAVHTPSLFISQEAGGKIFSPENTPFNPELKAKTRMKFVLACNDDILQQAKNILEFG